MVKKKTQKRPLNVVIVGGGFAGIKTALELDKVRGIRVTLISNRDHFLFYPALYATATGRSKRQSVLPLSDLFRDTDVNLIEDTVTSLDANRRLIVGKHGDVQYDKLVLALGVVTSYFGISGLDTYSYSIKSEYEIDRFKKHLHDELVQDKHLDKNYIIVGAGPTGVELAASLRHYLDRIAEKHKVSHKRIRLSLVEAAPRVLPRMSEQSSRLVENRLRSLGVHVMTDKKVESEDDDSIIISGRDIPSQTVVWTSGVANHPFFAEHPDVFKLAQNGRVEVDAQLKVSPDIYVIGDNAATPYTGLAQTAIYDGLFTARCIAAEAYGQAAPVYKPKKQPVVIPVGDNWALLEYGSLRLAGLLASLVRRAADMVGYLDYYPLSRAIKPFVAELSHEETCPVCLS